MIFKTICSIVGLSSDLQYHGNTSHYGRPVELHTDIYLIDDQIYVKLKDFSKVLGLQKHIAKEKTKLLCPFLINQGKIILFLP